MYLWCRNTVGHFFPRLRHVRPDDDEGPDGLEVEDIHDGDPFCKVREEIYAAFVDFFHTEVEPEANGCWEIEDIENEVIIADDEGREDVERVVAGCDENEEESNGNAHFLFILGRLWLLLLALGRALFPCAWILRRSARRWRCFCWSL